MSDRPEDKKSDFSNLPRGAISIKGLPVNRNTRLPSIRIPRDLTLGAQPKRTFTPNIPVRREKRAPVSKTENASSSVPDAPKPESKSPLAKGKGRGRGRELIQTGGGIFEQGTATVAKDRKPEPCFSRTGSSTKASSGRKMKSSKMSNMSQDMDMLMRDDFIDDGSDEEDEKSTRPVMFPIQEKTENELETKIKKEKASENFNDENFAKNLGFDVQKISKFIKKEKQDPSVTVKPTREDISNLPKNDVTDLLKNDEQLFLIKLPRCFTPNLQDGQTLAENSANEKVSNASISALPEGRLGKIQVLKSGKARLVVGSHKFQLDYVKHLSTKHEVVSVDTSDSTNTKSCDLVILANVKHLLNVSPDIVDTFASLKVT